MTSRALAWRTVAAEPARAALAICGVAVIGALLFDMPMLSRGLLVSFREMLDTTGYDVRVAATDAFPGRVEIANADEVAADIARLPEVRQVAIVRSDSAIVSLPNRPATEVALINVSPGAERQGWRIVSGVDLGAASHTASDAPAIVSRGLSQALGLRPGSTLPVRALVSGAASAVPMITFTVGRCDLSARVAAAMHWRRRSTRFSARAATSAAAADVILVASRAPPSRRRRRRARRRMCARSRTSVVGVSTRTAMLRQISFVLSTITLGFAFLLVATLLTVSVNQRLGQVAALRALGVPRHRIAATLVWESTLLVGAGGLLSLPTGWALALQLDRILRDMPNIPARMHFFVLEPSLVLWHLGLLAAAGVLAVVYPVWVATRLPIAATLRFETVT